MPARPALTGGGRSRRNIVKKSTLVIGALVLLAILAYSQRTTILTRVMERGIEARLGADIMDGFEDGLNVALCGAGGPMPAPNASGACVAVAAADKLFIVDVGTDSPRNLGRMGYQVGRVEAVLLTHFHSDHIDGLGELATLRWAAGDNASPLPVYGPPGVDKVVEGFNLAYSQDFVYRHEHHGDVVAPLQAAGLQARPFDTPPGGELVLVHEADGLRVEALAVDHDPVQPAVGYLFTYGGRSALISGDTAKSDNITQLARGVDLLVHEALAPNIVLMMNTAAEKIGNEIMAKVTFDIPDYHASPVEAAETARDAGVGHLLYYHIVPPILFPGQEAVWLDGAGDVFPDYTVGQDGTTFYLPVDSTEIIQTREGL